MYSQPLIQTKRTCLEILCPENAELMLRYYQENFTHLTPWEPARKKDSHSLQYWQDVLQKNRDMVEQGSAFRFSALNESRSEIIGVCNFSNVVYGAFQACHLGYSISEKYQGQGLMFEILAAGIEYVFDTIGLHRVMANYLPHNKRSESLLIKLGFEKEGLAKSYLKIAGKWQDHILTAKINLD